MEKFRVKFLLETLNCLQQELHKLNISLLVYQDSAKEQMKHIVESYNVSTIYLQKEWTDEENTSFNKAKDSLTKTVVFHEIYDQFLFHPEDIPFHFKETPKVFTHFRKQLEKKAKVRSLIKTHPQRASFLLETTTKIPTLKDLGYEDFEVDNRTVFPFYVKILHYSQ